MSFFQSSIESSVILTCDGDTAAHTTNDSTDTALFDQQLFSDLHGTSNASCDHVISPNPAAVVFHIWLGFRLRQHQKLLRLTANMSLSCPICPFTIESETALTRHIEDVHFSSDATTEAPTFTPTHTSSSHINTTTPISKGRRAQKQHILLDHDIYNTQSQNPFQEATSKYLDVRGPRAHAQFTNTTTPTTTSQSRNSIKPGALVQIVLKADQPTGKLTEGVVAGVLTNSANHPRGIKVRLNDGQGGRVQKILQASGLGLDRRGERQMASVLGKNFAK